MDNELKPCPFCDGEASVVTPADIEEMYSPPKGDCFRVECSAGLHSGYHYVFTPWCSKRKVALDLWNIRMGEEE